MASSVVEIYNLALQAIGESTFVQATTDQTLAAEVCNLQYPGCLRMLLQAYAWPWATQQADLNEAVDTYDQTVTYAAAALVRYEGNVYASVAGSNVGNTPSKDDATYWTFQYPSAIGWAYVYSLPADCVRPIALLLEGERVGLKTEDTKWPFEIQQNHAGDGQVLCCDTGPDDLEALEYVAMPQRDSARSGVELNDFPPMYPPLFVDALVHLLASKIAVPLTKNVDISMQCYKMHKQLLSEALTAELNAIQKDADPLPSSIRARE